MAEQLQWQKQQIPGKPGEYSEWYIKATTDKTITCQGHKGEKIEMALTYTVTKSKTASGFIYSAWRTREKSSEPNSVGIKENGLAKVFESAAEAKQECQRDFDEYCNNN